MSSASVFSSHVLAELRHIRSATTVSADRASRNFTPNYAALSAVRRNIFGPVDHEECRNFVEKQLKQQLNQDTEYWGFDFDLEVPLPGSRSRFKWEAVPEKPVSRPHKRPLCEPVYDISHLYPEPLDDVRPASDENAQKAKTKEQQIEKVKQSLITDFLKSRKNGSSRLQQLKKNMSVTPSPNRTGKISRTRRTVRS